MHYAVIDLGYGDAGKGIVTARLCQEHDIEWIIRTSGGCQAAHNVITDDGRHHTFAQFGSGTLNSDARTYLSRYMLVEPFALLREAQALEQLGVKDPLKRVVIDPRALITTPYHWELNRWREEQRGDQRHGSTGRGIGATTEFALIHSQLAPRMGDMHRGPLSWRLRRVREWCIAQGVPEDRLPPVLELVERYRSIEDLIVLKINFTRFLDYTPVVFEGAQGVLLDEDYGFHPHTTWTKTTDANVHSFFVDHGVDASQLTTIGVTRTYMTRHGAGPLVGEADAYPEEIHNGTGKYQGAWRKGHLDLVALQYAKDCMNQLDRLYVTHTDVTPSTVITGYHHDNVSLKLEKLPVDAFAERQAQTEALSRARGYYGVIPQGQTAEWLSDALGVPLIGTGWGPQIKDGEWHGTS